MFKLDVLMLTHKVPGIEFLNALFSIVWSEFVDIWHDVKCLEDDPSKVLLKTPKGDKIVATTLLTTELQKLLMQLFTNIISGNVNIILRKL